MIDDPVNFLCVHLCSNRLASVPLSFFLGRTQVRSPVIISDHLQDWGFLNGHFVFFTWPWRHKSGCGERRLSGTNDNVWMEPRHRWKKVFEWLVQPGPGDCQKVSAGLSGWTMVVVICFFHQVCVQNSCGPGCYLSSSKKSLDNT